MQASQLQKMHLANRSYNGNGKNLNENWKIKDIGIAQCNIMPVLYYIKIQTKFGIINNIQNYSKGSNYMYIL